ncbi:permease [Candidatus Woesearchaeota archaeon]|nr:permease [Candidatus Woesearchaeota archaeon]
MTLEELTHNAVTSLFNITNERLAEALTFFIYDTVQILLLLFVMIGVMGVIRTYIPSSKIKKALSGKRKGVGNVFASLFGAVTPFCSCSSIPVFITMVEAGVPLGVNFSFLITSPLVNEYVAVIMFAVFGWKITLAYIIAGILIGIIGGMILGRMKLEKHLVEDIANRNGNNKERKYAYFSQRLRFGLDEAKDIVKKVGIYVVIGIGVAAAVHGYVPESFFEGIVSKGGIFAVPLAVILGVPLYANCAAIIPLAAVLVEKGIPLGTTLAFVMSTAALSLPEAIILRRAMNLKLIGIFFGIVAISIVLIGYLFNLIV